MRLFIATAILALSTNFAYAVEETSVPDAPAKPEPIAAVNAPATSAPVDKTIKTVNDNKAVVRSAIITDAPLKNDHVLGKRNAPVVMVEYASLSCPHCAHFSTTILPTLEKKYIDTGKMAYILRQFPLNEPAMRAAMLVYCVGESSEEQYYVFSRVLFDAQNRWAFDSNYMDGLETIAGVGGVNREQFKNCTSDKDREMRVLKDKKTANDELKVPHTPFIVIGGEVYEGDMTVEAISKFIDAKLAKSKR